VFSSLIVLTAAADSDFTGLTDIEVLMHEDSAAGIAEFQRRAKDYSKDEIRAIEQEYFKRLTTPSLQVELTVPQILAKINATEDSNKHSSLFKALGDRYKAAGSVEKEHIRAAFLTAWEEIPYPTSYDVNHIPSMLRFRAYAHEAGVYFPTEAELIPLLETRCLHSEAYDSYDLYADVLLGAKVSLGPIAAESAEQVYLDAAENAQNTFGNCNLYVLESRLLRVMGRSGKPGFDALLRIGKEDSELGYGALGMNVTPEAELLLWDLYESKNHNQYQTRLKILRALVGKRGSAMEQSTRQARIRGELVSYLALPVGSVNVRTLQSAVALVTDTKDPYYLPHVENLERTFFSLSPEEYHCPGMDDRMEEVMVSLREDFSDAKSRLGRARWVE